MLARALCCCIWGRKQTVSKQEEVNSLTCTRVRSQKSVAISAPTLCCNICSGNPEEGVQCCVSGLLFGWNTLDGAQNDSKSKNKNSQWQALLRHCANKSVSDNLCSDTVQTKQSVTTFAATLCKQNSQWQPLLRHCVMYLFRKPPGSHSIPCFRAVIMDCNQSSLFLHYSQWWNLMTALMYCRLIITHHHSLQICPTDMDLGVDHQDPMFKTHKPSPWRPDWISYLPIFLVGIHTPSITYLNGNWFVQFVSVWAFTRKLIYRTKTEISEKPPENLALTRRNLCSKSTTSAAGNLCTRPGHEGLQWTAFSSWILWQSFLHCGEKERLWILNCAVFRNKPIRSKTGPLFLGWIQIVSAARNTRNAWYSIVSRLASPRKILGEKKFCVQIFWALRIA